jgi:hypothetical protein
MDEEAALVESPAHSAVAVSSLSAGQVSSQWGDVPWQWQLQVSSAGMVELLQ